MVFTIIRLWYNAHKMSTNEYAFWSFFGCNLYFWGFNADFGEKCARKCAQNAYKKLAKVSKCHDLSAFVLICTRLFAKIGVRSQS